MRFVPEVDHKCHVCGAVFRFHTGFDPHKGFSHRPDTCPACEAPMRHWYPPDVGRAKDLLAQQRRGLAREYLERECRTPEEVEAYLEAARSLSARVRPALESAAGRVKADLEVHRRKHLAIRHSRT